MGQTDDPGTPDCRVTLDDVNRVLEVGRLLLSVLTPEEIEEIRESLEGETFQRSNTCRRKKQVTLASLDAGIDIS